MWLSLMRIAAAEIGAVVAAAAGAHRRLLEHAPAGRGLARVDHARAACRRPRRRTRRDSVATPDSRCRKLSAVRSAARTRRAPARRASRDARRAALDARRRPATWRVEARCAGRRSANTARATSRPETTSGSRASERPRGVCTAVAARGRCGGDVAAPEVLVEREVDQAADVAGARSRTADRRIFVRQGS